MKKAFSLLLVIALCAISSTALAKGDLTKDNADKVFQLALVADQAGHTERREQLIKETLRLDPNHKLARWHSGQVLFNGQWKTVDAISRLVSQDPRWQEYRERVGSSVDSLQSHADVARWCRAQKLELEEQWHWFNVLRHDASNREALGSLGLRPYKGELLTTEQIAEYKASEEQAEVEFKRYAKLLKSAIREAELSDGTKRTAALKKISEIKDPVAIQAIVEVVLADGKNENRILSKLGSVQGEKLLRQIHLAAIAAISEMPEHAATLQLLDVALFASDEQIRSDATQALKYRELTDFVPLLMAGLAEPIEVSLAVNTLPNGQITVLTDFYESGPLAERKHSTSSDYLTQYVQKSTNNLPGVIRSRRRGIPGVARVDGVWTNHARDVQNASAQIANTQEQVAFENSRREENNTRINKVLGVVFEKEDGDPKVWWNAWKDYNELYTPDVLPTYETEQQLDYTQQFVREFRYGRTASCFVAGTPVWTPSGKVAIETVKIGDLVLSQNPHTGELNYRPVVNTTVRPPSGTINIGIENETIVTTRGHRMWVTGLGWKMAKLLEAGQQLVTVSGSVDLQSATKGEEAVAYNLEVGQFHTYFVGESRLLVHDNTCPQPTTNIMPGVSPRASFAPQLAVRN
jgi:hypothetical protein